MNTWEQFQRDLEESYDLSRFMRLYEQLSVDPQSFYLSLQDKELTFCAFDTGHYPPKDALLHSANTIRNEHSNKAAISGLLTSLHPLLLLPAELMQLTLQLQLTQKISLVYGINPHSTAGKNKLIRALLFAHNPVSALSSWQKEERSWLKSGQSLIPMILKKGLKRRLVRIIPAVGGALSYRELYRLGTKIITWYSSHYRDSNLEHPALTAQEVTQKKRF